MTGTATAPPGLPVSAAAWAEAMARGRKMFLRNLLFAAVVVVALFGLNFAVKGAVSSYVSRIIILAGISVILAVSLNLINGYTGQFSLGHAGFMAIGAYTSAYFSFYYG